MDDNRIFREALKNFMFDVAGGGAIEHLADCGYTPTKIHEMLDYPIPCSQVREAFWKYCLKNKIIVEERSALREKRETVNYITEYDTYGRKSLRRVVAYEDDNIQTPNAYVSCDFGLRLYRSPEEYEAFLAPLTEEQRLYIKDIPWKRKLVWHQLDQRMKEILTTLYEKSDYHGSVLLLEKNDEITF